MNGPGGEGRRVSIAILAIALTAAAACGDGATDLERAREAADYNDRARAVGFYQLHLDANPDDFDIRLEYTLLLGEEWAYQGGDPEPILENLEILFQADPGNLRVRELFAMMLIRQGQASVAARRYDEGEALYLRAADVHPDVGTASYHLGVLYSEQGRPQEAFTAWVAAALKRPQIPDLYLRLGREYLAREQLDRAINTLLLVDELQGTSTYLLPETNCALAAAYLQRGDVTSAQARFDSAGANCAVAGLER
jgi:tetratricopeptide (TPR) repeat protein